MREEERGFKRVHNQMGNARPLKLLNITSWLISRRHDKPQDERINKKARKQIGKQANKKEDKQAKKANKRCCPRGTNVGLDRMSIASLC